MSFANASAQKSKGWRVGFMTVTVAMLALLSLMVVAINVYFTAEERDNLALHSAAVRTDSIVDILNRQIEITQADHGLRHDLATSFSDSDPIAWSGLVEYRQSDLDRTISTYADQTGIPEEELQVQVERAFDGETRNMARTDDIVLVASSLADQHVLLVAYDSSMLRAEPFGMQRHRWVVGFAFLMIAAFVALAAIQYYVRGPLERLSRALRKAENALDLQIEPPLPNNQVGWLAEQIKAFLSRLRTTRAELFQMATIVNRTASAAMILDRKLRVHWINHAFEEMSGYSADEIRGQLPADFLIGKNAQVAAKRRFLDSIRAGEGCVQEIEVTRKDGETRWVVAELQPVRDDDGMITGWVGVNTDITDMKSTEAELAERVGELERLRAEQAQLTKELTVAKRHAEAMSRNKSDLLANMSHEIRTPMNGVLGMTEMLKSTTLSEEQSKYVTTIKDCGEALLKLLNDILDLSKLEAGKLALDKQPLNIRNVTDSVAHLLEPRAREKHLKLTTKVARDVPDTLVGDGGRLRQILMNLVGNAIKFTDNGDIQIRIDEAQDGAALRVEVADTGRGIPHELQARLFERFEQGKESATPGTGLGLSICQELVRLMGGNIGVESKEGEGSTFWFEIPLEAYVQPVEGEDMTDGEEGNSCGKKLHILLAEDHPVNQSLMKAFITKLGHDFEIAEDGVEAVKAVRSKDFDLILMDIQMPRMDGVMATKVIRSLETPAAQIPIIAVTAHAMTGQREHYLGAGMSGYVSKPVQLSTLAEEINRVLQGESEATDQPEQDAQEGERERRVS